MDQGEIRAGLTAEIRVWDAGVRVFHWLLAGAVLGAAYTGFFEKRLALGFHLMLGIGVVALLGFRLVWGFLGGTFARFASFLYPPRVVARHVRGLGEPKPERHLGHNPLGALMVFALLAVLAAIAASGTVALGGVLKQGPLAAFTSYATGRTVLLIHGGLAILLVVMVLAHLGGVVFESRRHGENLARAMVTGRKRLLPSEEAGLDRVSHDGTPGLAHWRAPARARPFAAAAILGVGFLVGAAGVMRLAARPGFGVPPAHVDKTYAADCSSCHMAYPPELLPASSWAAIMADLTNHFGEDASLGRRDTAAIAAYLKANAAGRWDTLPAHLFRVVDPAKPMMISATPAWRRIHRHIPAAVFKARAVGSPAHCSACHADAASGRFAPQNIHIPERAMP
jgi:cytochrome b